MIIFAVEDFEVEPLDENFRQRLSYWKYDIVHCCKSETFQSLNRILNLAKNTMKFLIKDKRQILLIFITMFSGMPKRVSDSQSAQIEPDKWSNNIFCVIKLNFRIWNGLSDRNIYIFIHHLYIRPWMGWCDFDIFWNSKFMQLHCTELSTTLHWTNYNLCWWLPHQLFPCYFPSRRMDLSEPKQNRVAHHFSDILGNRRFDMATSFDGWVTTVNRFADEPYC